MEVTTIGKYHHSLEEISPNKDYKMKINIEVTKTQKSKQKWNEKMGKSMLNYDGKYTKVIMNRGK